MNLKEAVQAMREGKKVRRKEWQKLHSELFIRFQTSVDERFIVTNGGDPYTIFEDDFEADDWEIVKDISLSGKMVYTTQVTVNDTAETNFVSKDIYDRFKDPDKLALLKAIDVKIALIKFINKCNKIKSATENIRTTECWMHAKEIFGDELI